MPNDEEFDAEDLEVASPSQVAEILRQAEAARARLQGPGPAGPMPPMPPMPAPSPQPRFPAAAQPGTPPPPLPESGSRFVDPVYPDPPDGYVDPVLDDGLANRQGWRSRLQATPIGDWSIAHLLRADAPMRRSRTGAFVMERGLRITVATLPERSLNPAPPGVPLVSRLRMLHERLLPRDVYCPVSAAWYELGGQPAVLDRLAQTPGGPTAGFCLSTELEHDLGLLAFGFAPSGRRDALVQVGIPLAATARISRGAVHWATPPGWSRAEELQLTTDMLQATVRLEPLGDGWGLQEWTDSLFADAPFLRDMKTVGDREVTVPGIEVARLRRFDWQPAGRGRMLTTLIAGVTGGLGFSFVFEVPFDAEADVLLADPDAIVAMVSVAPTP